MKRTSMRWAATAVCSVSVLLMGASVSKAGLVPWVWNALFGPHCPSNQCSQPACGTPCAPSYAPSPCGPSGCGVQNAFFAPSGCSTCGSSACGPAGCSTGECGLTSATGARTSEPSPPPAQTYKEGDDATTDEKWNPTDPEADMTDDGASPAGDEDGAVETETFKPATVVPKKDAPAPTPDLNESDDAQAEEEEETGSTGPDFFNTFDGKVTWRPAIGRTRLQRKPTYAAARLIRKPRHAPGKWMPVLTPANVAKR